MNIINNVLFIALPYVALSIFLLGTIYRYRNLGFKYSSLSSQFLEGKKLFWNTLLFHFGILVVILGHIFAFIFPSALIFWNSNPIRLLALEGFAVIFALSSLVGIFGLLKRRFNMRIQIVSNKMDFLIEALIFFQVILGIWTAIAYRWGSSWFAADLTPYLRSIFLFNPEINCVISLPLIVKFHIIGAFIIIFIFPFTRLVHILVAPFHYVIRPYQLVIWYWDRKSVRSSSNIWTNTRPNNN